MGVGAGGLDAIDSAALADCAAAAGLSSLVGTTHSLDRQLCELAEPSRSSSATVSG